MKFIQKRKLELGDTLVPDLFIMNNLKSLQANEIKIYLYLLYMLKSEQEIDSDDLNKALDITNDELKAGLEVLVAEELVQKTTKGYTVVDLKEVEINKTYTQKLTKVKKNQPDVDKKRNQCAEAINAGFFNSYMSLGWYTDIGILFNTYNFTEDVMIALFQYCKERNAINKKYVFAVAETWFNGGVKTFEDLENYLEYYDKITKMKQKIAKTLGYSRNLTKYEEADVKKWIEEYHYEFDIIEEGLKKSANTANPTIKYIDAIITSWYKKGFTTLEEIMAEEAPKETKTATVKKATVSDEPKKKAYQSYSTKREYDSSEDFYDDI